MNSGLSRRIPVLGGGKQGSQFRLPKLEHCAEPEAPSNIASPLPLLSPFPCHLGSLVVEGGWGLTQGQGPGLWLPSPPDAGAGSPAGPVLRPSGLFSAPMDPIEAWRAGHAVMTVCVWAGTGPRHVTARGLSTPGPVTRGRVCSCVGRFWQCSARTGRGGHLGNHQKFVTEQSKVEVLRLHQAFS